MKSKIKGKNIEYYKCLSCGNMWNVTNESTNICVTCGGRNALYCSDFAYDVTPIEVYTELTGDETELIEH